jgi:DNA-binding NarL/FixJ family response regulator
MKIHVVLADDHQLLREGIRSILSKEPDVEVVGEAENGRQAMELVEKTKPNVVIMDISMPNLNGIEATRKIKEAHPEAKIIALSMHQDKRFIASMLEAGASGFLLKDCATEELIKSIHTVMQNKTYLSPLISTSSSAIM